MTREGQVKGPRGTRGTGTSPLLRESRGLELPWFCEQPASCNQALRTGEGELLRGGLFISPLARRPRVEQLWEQ
jgi:hypothetical protein